MAKSALRRNQRRQLDARRHKLSRNPMATISPDSDRVAGCLAAVVSSESMRFAYQPQEADLPP